MLAWIGFPAGASGATVESPSPFSDDYGARVTSFGDEMWAAVTGKDGSGRMRTAVLRRHRNGWRPLPGRPAAYWDGSLQIEAFRLRGDRGPTVCVTDTDPRERVRLRCFRNGRWTRMAVDRRIRHDRLVLGLRSWQGELFAVLTISRSRTKPLSVIRVARLNGRRLIPFGPAYTGKRPDRQLISALGTSTRNTRRRSLDLAVLEFSAMRKQRRWVVSFSPRIRRWTETRQLPRAEMGSQSEMARARGRLFVPVSRTTFSDQYWPFSVYTSRPGGAWRKVGGADLNPGGLNGQGSVYPVGNRIWVV